jgi:hypothetical protein
VKLYGSSDAIVHKAVTMLGEAAQRMGATFAVDRRQLYALQHAVAQATSADPASLQYSLGLIEV